MSDFLKSYYRLRKTIYIRFKCRTKKISADETPLIASKTDFFVLPFVAAFFKELRAESNLELDTISLRIRCVGAKRKGNVCCLT